MERIEDRLRRHHEQAHSAAKALVKCYEQGDILWAHLHLGELAALSGLVYNCNAKIEIQDTCEHNHTILVEDRYVVCDDCEEVLNEDVSAPR